MSDPLTNARASLARLYNYGRTPTPEAVAAARRAVTSAKLERDIREALGVEHPLPQEERNRLALLLINGR